MSKTGGRATFKGINAQALAAFSLFLQYARTSDLQQIAFEQDKLKDFDLVFTKKKIICESRTTKITAAGLKDILKALIDNKKVSNSDEILIVCEEVSSDLEGSVVNFEYFKDLLKDELHKKGFTEKHLALFPKIKFWKVNQDTNELIILSIFPEILGVWVPEKTMDEIISEIILSKVYKGSASGGILTRNDFYQILEEKKKQIQSDAGYEDKKSERFERIEQILNALNNPGSSRDWCNDQISLLSTTPDLYYLAIKKLESLTNLKLSQWDNLWKAATKGTFSLQVFNIFQKNLDNPENQKYLIGFLPSITNKLISFYRQEFFIVDVVKICSGILEKTRSYENEIFEILKSLLILNSKEYFYIQKKGDDKWEQEEITKSLKVLYEGANKKVRQKIFEFILSFFNLIKDDGEHWHYTPNQIFEIVKLHIEGDIENGILTLSKELVGQYEKFYKRFRKKSIFKGWEHMGFSDTDRHFIIYIIRPILNSYYAANPDKAWQFIKKLITTKEGSVSKERPDYLNRASVPVIISAYQNPKYKKEALGILKDFVEMKNGIPHKREIVYRQVLGSPLPDDQKLELVKLQLNYTPWKGLPANEYVEKIVGELANRGNTEALAILETWASNPEYNKRRGIAEENVISMIPGLLANPTTKARGISILKKFLDSDFFINKLDLWNVWETDKVVAQVLIADFNEGKSLLQKMWASKKLSRNQQVLLTNTVNALDEKSGIIKKAYDEIVSQWLIDCKDDLKIILQRIPDIQSRMSIVQFGEKLAKEKAYKEAIRIAKVFIDDPDPTLENASDDPKGEHNHHEQIKRGEEVLSITSVRVWVAELLENFAVLSARDYIPEILPLVEKLTKDPNFYVRAFSCMPLQQLTQQRNTVLPTDPKTRFLEPKVAEEIEKISYFMLRNKENRKLKQVMRGLLRVFDSFRRITEDEAKEILETILNTKDSTVIEEARSLFIFFAEFRTKLNKINLDHIFSKERIEELSKFDDKYFKDLLIKVIKDSPGEVKAGFTWAFWQLPKEPGANFEKAFSISYKYLSLLVEQYEHEVMTDVYYFIEENIDKKFDECFDLWKKCLKVERPYLQANINKDNLYQMHWWPYHYNGKILVKIAEERGEEEFLKQLDYLLGYPDGVIIASDLSIVIDRLITLPVTDKAKTIFKKIVIRNSEYFEKMKEWIKNENVQTS